MFGCLFILQLNSNSLLLKHIMLHDIVQNPQFLHYHMIFGENVNRCTRKKRLYSCVIKQEQKHPSPHKYIYSFAGFLHIIF